MASPKTAIVTGDITTDWLIARRRRVEDAGQQWNEDDASRVYSQAGGAALLAQVLIGLGKRLPFPLQVVKPPPCPEGAVPSPRHCCHTHAVWSPVSTESRGSRPGWEGTWRVSEFLGLNPPKSERVDLDLRWMKLGNEPAQPDLVLVDDAALGFRQGRGSGAAPRPAPYWPQVLQKRGCPSWVLLKMAAPVARGDLWRHLVATCPEHLVVVMEVNDLRRSKVRISRGLSWERAAQDLYWELVHNPNVNGVALCRHAVISFGLAGALVLSSNRQPGDSGSPSAPQCTLYFDPEKLEGVWRAAGTRGMVGYTTCLTAALARQLLENPEKPDLAAGLQAGRSAMEVLDRLGWGEAGRRGDLERAAVPPGRGGGGPARAGRQAVVGGGTGAARGQQR